MFEFWFHGLDDGDGPFIHHGTTHDFLEVCCQIAQCYDFKIAGEFVRSVLTEHAKELSFLRVVDWKIDYTVDVNDDIGLERKIVLHKRKVA
jgi:hypothetical protein